MTRGIDVTAVYPGTFDPITNGHLDILERALALFDKVIVAIGVNERKQPLFTVEQRQAFIRDAMAELGYADRLEFTSFSGLLVDLCREHGATVFGYYVHDPERYGVAEFDAAGKLVGLEEKPSAPKSN